MKINKQIYLFSSVYLTSMSSSKSKSRDSKKKKPDSDDESEPKKKKNKKDVKKEEKTKTKEVKKEEVKKESKKEEEVKKEAKEEVKKEAKEEVKKEAKKEDVKKEEVKKEVKKEAKEEVKKEVKKEAKKEEVKKIEKVVSLKEFIFNLLKTETDIEEKVCNELLSKYISEFEKCFTHKSIDPVNNYEYYELMGDSVVAPAVLQYCSAKFPNFKNANGVKFLARQKMLIANKLYLSNMAHSLGFDKYIRFSEEDKSIQIQRRDENIRDKKIVSNSLKEDCFEAFVGCLMMCVNEYIPNKDLGIVCGLKFVKKQLDKIKIPSTREELWDSKSIIKEIFDRRKHTHKEDKLWYTFEESKIGSGDSEHTLYTCTVHVIVEGREQAIGMGSDPKKSVSEQKAADQAMKTLKSLGIDVNKQFKPK